MKDMRIVIDSTPLLLRSAGVKTYLYYWARYLRRLAGDEIALFPFLPHVDEFSHEASVVGRGATWARLALVHAANHAPFPLLNSLIRGASVFHASHQLLAPPTNVPVTATIYDTTCWLFPETQKAANIIYLRAFADRVMKRAAGLIAISESTRADAVRVLGLAEERIEVIYPGVAPEFFDARPKAAPRPYVLSVGTVEPRKNLGVLLDAFEGLPESIRAEFELVIAGPAGWGDRSILRRLDAGIPGVRYLGYVPERDLPGLTAGATAFAYPSLYEGFGLPLAQAMAAGVPCITSNVSSLPEVAGDCGVLVDPNSVAEIRDNLAGLLTSPALRSRLGAAGRKRAELFRWERSASASLDFFRRIT